MSVEELHTTLLQIDGVDVRPGEAMTAHTPLRVGGDAELWAVIRDLDALKASLTAARANNVKWRLHWPFQDWLVRDGGLRGVTLRPGRGFEGLARLEGPGGERLRIGSATPWAALAGLGDGWWSELARWPGTPGGLFQDGEQDRLSGMCAGVRWWRGRSVDEIPCEGDVPPPELPRTAVLLDVDLRPGFLLYDGVEGPLPPRSGLLFEDPVVAGRRRPVGGFLKEADIPGSRLRAWRMSTEEPGLVVNLGGGSAEDLKLFAKGISARLEKSRGIKLDLRLPTRGRRPLAPRRAIRSASKR